jgi:hypothetical protein
MQLSKTYCKTKMARKVVFLNCILSCIINLHSLIFLGGYHEDEENGEMRLMCAASEGTLYYLFLEPYAKYIDLICYAFLPFAIMAVCTILIVRVLIKV